MGHFKYLRPTCCDLNQLKVIFHGDQLFWESSSLPEKTSLLISLFSTPTRGISHMGNIILMGEIILSHLTS